MLGCWTASRNPNVDALAACLCIRGEAETNESRNERIFPLGNISANLRQIVASKGEGSVPAQIRYDVTAHMPGSSEFAFPTFLGQLVSDKICLMDYINLSENLMFF